MRVSYHGAARFSMLLLHAVEPAYDFGERLRISRDNDRILIKKRIEKERIFIRIEHGARVSICNESIHKGQLLDLSRRIRAQIDIEKRRHVGEQIWFPGKHAGEQKVVRRPMKYEKEVAV